MLVGDNQQATISWFCGFLEAEGCCGGSGNRRVIRLTNTDESLITVCEKILQQFGVLYRLYERRFRHQKRQLTLAIHGIDCESLMRILDSKFQCRKQEFLQKLYIGASTTTCDAPLTPDLHWLVGVFEGEGCFSLRESINCYTPEIRFGNSNERIINKYVLTLKEAWIPWYTYKRVLEGYKTAYEIRVGGLMRCKRFFDKFKGLWQSKIYSKRAEKLLEFINSRLHVPKGSPYTELQRQIYLMLR